MVYPHRELRSQSVTGILKLALMGYVYWVILRVYDLLKEDYFCQRWLVFSVNSFAVKDDNSYATPSLFIFLLRKYS